MALLQISEPGQSTAPHQHHLAVGIDLGTTNSLVATVRSGLPETLADEQGQHLLSSVVHYHKNGVNAVGNAAQAYAYSDNDNTISSVKRLMGHSYTEIAENSQHYAVTEQDGQAFLQTAAGLKSPVQVSGDILNHLKQRAEHALEGELEGVVITVPAYFDDAQRQATKDAAKLAGLNVLRLLNEPTAAAVAYGLDQKAEGIHAIYDLGGGTFDISILRLQRGVFEVIATAGDAALGGDDMDHAVAEQLLKRANYQNLNHSQLRYVRQMAREIKQALTETDSISYNIAPPGLPACEIKVERTEFNQWIDKLIQKTLMPCRRALRDAGIDKSEINAVVMVGGSTRVPRVREKIAAFFACELHVDIDPDKVVALGAAIQANALVGNKADEELLLLDVTPLSLGIETMGGLVEKIIPRNTAIPVTRAQDFTTFKDGQTAMALHVLQGERDVVSDCRSLAQFELRGIPAMVAGGARIRVSFQVDADGLLTVAATEESTGIQTRVEVKPSYGLGDDKVEKMLRDAMEHAQEDVQARRLKEQQVEAQRTLEALEGALAKDAALLSTEEKTVLLQHRDQLIDLIQANDANAIKQGIKTLEQASRNFVARRMDAGIRAAMQGHSVNEF